jgi:hypothetical protein
MLLLLLLELFMTPLPFTLLQKRTIVTDIHMYISNINIYMYICWSDWICLVETFYFGRGQKLVVVVVVVMTLNCCVLVCVFKNCRCIAPARNVPSHTRTVCYTSRCLLWWTTNFFHLMLLVPVLSFLWGEERVLESSVAVGTYATGSQITHTNNQEKDTLKITKFLSHQQNTQQRVQLVEPTRERNYRIIGSWTMMIHTTTIIITMIIMMIMPRTI